MSGLPPYCRLFEVSHLCSLRLAIVPRRGTHQRKQTIARKTAVLQITAKIFGPDEEVDVSEGGLFVALSRREASDDLAEAPAPGWNATCFP